METIKGRITHATKTETEWNKSTVVLLKGEVGFASDTQVIKVGNGKDLWKNLKSHQGGKGDPLTIKSTTKDSKGNTVITFSDGTKTTINKGDKGDPLDVDLSNYATKDDLSKVDVSGQLADYAKKGHTHEEFGMVKVGDNYLEVVIVNSGEVPTDTRGLIVFERSQRIMKNGIFEEDGGLFYYENDERTFKGVFKMYGNFYNANQSGKLVVDTSAYITKTNDIVKRGRYNLDSRGRILIPDGTVMRYVVTDGIVQDLEDGEFYKVKDGQREYAGIFKGDDGHYYCAGIGGKLHRGRKISSGDFLLGVIPNSAILNTDSFGRIYFGEKKQWESITIDGQPIKRVWSGYDCLWSGERYLT